MIISGLCKQYRLDILNGVHQKDHIYKMALYNSMADLSKETKFYTEEGEVSGIGYIRGGNELEGFYTFMFNDTACLDFTIDPEWPNSVIIANGALIYNDSLPGKNSVCVISFGGTFASNNGTFKYIFPEPTESEALVRIK